jgi:D-alanyl-D-alanine carboxypeptidase
MVADAQDLARFHSALLTGELLSSAALSAMRQTVATPIGAEDGLGIFALDFSCGRFWGHDGGILDYLTQVAASEDGRRVAVISVRPGPSFSASPPISKVLCPGSVR